MSSTLPCPSCCEAGVDGSARIGNRRSECAMCNAFAQRVMRQTRTVLKREHAAEYETVRSRIEVEVYEGMVRV